MLNSQEDQSQEKTPAPEKRNEWTVMVYLAGDNNLAEEMIFALKSMQLVGSMPPYFEVIALYDSGGGAAIIEIPDRRPANGDPPSDPPATEIRTLAEKSHKKERTRVVDRRASELRAAGIKKQKLDQEVLDARQDLAGQVTTYKTAAAYSEPGLDSEKVRLAKIEELQKKILNAAEAANEFNAAQGAHDEAKKAEGEKREIVETVQSTLTEFVVRTIEGHPAERYMLVLSGHGSGAVGDFLTGRSHVFGLGIPGLAEALADVRKRLENRSYVLKGNEYKYLPDARIDILGLDSCLMGMAEVAYEVRDSVNYLIGTEGFEANTGWPYDGVLNLLNKRPAQNARQLAQNIVRQYQKYYSDYTLAGTSTDISALDLTPKPYAEKLSRLENFVEALRGLTGPLKETMEKALKEKKDAVEPAPADERSASVSDALRIADAVVLAHWEAQGFKDEQHIDVKDFCDLLQKRWRKNPVWTACETVKQAVDELVIASGSCGPAFQYSNGISIFFPWANITDAASVPELEHYNSLRFAQDTQWDEFLTSYHQATQRTPRGGYKGALVGRLNRREGLFTGKPGKGDSAFPKVRADSAFTRVRVAGVASPDIASMKNPPVLYHDRFSSKKK